MLRVVICPILQGHCQDTIVAIFEEGSFEIMNLRIREFGESGDLRTVYTGGLTNTWEIGRHWNMISRRSGVEDLG